jgi:hypothetical protein
VTEYGRELRRASTWLQHVCCALAAESFVLISRGGDRGKLREVKMLIACLCDYKLEVVSTRGGFIYMETGITEVSKNGE